MTASRKTAGGLLGLHAQTPVHPGAGTALGVVDLPIQRERHTHWPNAAGSSLKGILRDACREAIAGKSDAELDQLDRHDDFKPDGSRKEGAERPKRDGSRKTRADHTLMLNELFGPPTSGASEFAGALSVTDARLAAFPVRSLKGVFAWVTCPGVLDRLARDAELAGVALPPSVPGPEKQFQAVAHPACPCRLAGSGTGPEVVFEEFKFDLVNGNPGPVGKWIADTLLPAGPAYAGTRDRFTNALVVLHDDDFTHFAWYATEILARIKLNYETKTVDRGALFYQEFLPAETLLYSVVLANPARGRSAATPAELLGRLAADLPTVLQVGGDESVGKGYCGVRLTLGTGGTK